MKQLWTAIALTILITITIVVTANAGLAQLSEPKFELPSLPAPELFLPVSTEQAISTACAVQPRSNLSQPPVQQPLPKLPLERFRQLQAKGGMPKEEIAVADGSNYGDRYLRDAKGNPALLPPIVVLHETVGSANSAINLFRNYHANNDDQVSYHTLIRQDGTVVYVVPPEKRAFGAGNSVFRSQSGTEAIRLNAELPPSVNNFAYHISLETPADGNNNGFQHSGYTTAQYQSLAWLVAKTGVANDRITTHQRVDRSGQRIDPRSFNQAKFLNLLDSYPKTAEIAIRCTDPT
jgi:hypothetical protein